MRPGKEAWPERERESRLCVFVCEKEKETDNAQKCRKIPPN